MAKEAGLKCTVLDEKQMQRLGMGGILAVGAGSELTPPRMIILESRGGRASGAARKTNRCSSSVRRSLSTGRHFHQARGQNGEDDL